MNKKIIVKNARQNNLKNLSIEIPYYKLNVVTGNSGSGKSSLVYDTIYAESQRLMFESLVDNTFGLKIMDKPDVDSIENLCPAISISQLSYNFNPNSTVGSFTDIYASLRSIFAIVATDLKKEPFVARDFSSQQSKYRCEKCSGTGRCLQLSIDKLIPNKNMALNKGGIIYFSGANNCFEMQLLEMVCERHGIDVNLTVDELSKKDLDILLYGDGEKYVVKFERGSKKNCQKTLQFGGAMGILGEDFKKIHSPMIQKQLAKYTDECLCDSCVGSGFKHNILDIEINKKNFKDISEMECADILSWAEGVKKNYDKKSYSKMIMSNLKYVCDIVEAMKNLDIEYLSLERSIPTLSGGEFQRLRLSKQIAGSLSEILYILDEPCKGLHKIDIGKIKNVSKELIQKGNTVLAIEHNHDYLSVADNIYTIGPGSGPEGGEICKNDDYSDGIVIGKVNHKLRNIDTCFEFKNINVNNISRQNVKIPIGAVTFITGVSGSGKSTLAEDVIYNSLELGYGKNCQTIFVPRKYGKVFYVNQNPIGKNARSTVISYLNIYDEIRKLFSEISVGGKKIKSGFFSTNCEGGRCEKCSGSGVIAISSNYFPDSYVMCDECDGKRFQSYILDVKYKGYNISDVLDLTVSQAKALFADNSKIKKMLQCIIDIGLDYLKLGQLSKNLSGGEAQRLKLAKALGEENSKKENIYILDEPTSGLSQTDTKKIEQVIQSLAEEGHTIIIIEHNVKFISENADYIVDFGFSGGKNGGKIIDEGPAFEVLNRGIASIC